ncbi:hypothetical protein BDF21DRAFT_397964 [Thamnidium elegans]|nr:hypothetical protein BDF21DRAFT_397964 [Thamnidium elegans]
MILPPDVPDDYTIPQSTRSLLNLPSYVLTTPIINIADIENHINVLPTDVILKNQASQIYYKIKDALNTVIDSPKSSSVLFERTREYFRHFLSKFTRWKFKKEFMELYNAKLASLQHERVVSESRKKMYKQAQLLAVDLVSQSMQEFREEFIISKKPCLCTYTTDEEEEEEFSVTEPCLD